MSRALFTLPHKYRIGDEIDLRAFILYEGDERPSLIGLFLRVMHRGRVVDGPDAGMGYYGFGPLTYTNHYPPEYRRTMAWGTILESADGREWLMPMCTWPWLAVAPVVIDATRPFESGTRATMRLLPPGAAVKMARATGPLEAADGAEEGLGGSVPLQGEDATRPRRGARGQG